MNNNTEFASAKVESIKKGKLVKRSPDDKKLYLRGDYCREAKKYFLNDYDDISRSILVKKGTVLFTDWRTNED